MTKIVERVYMRVGDVISVMPRKHKIQTSEYLKEGLIPVIDQSIHFIAGYIDDGEKAYDGPFPVVVFGDHTCIFKYVDFQFAVGADGTQLIRPKDENLFDIRYLFYCLRSVPLEQFGYQRHFKYLKEGKIPFCPLDLQVRIASILSVYDDLIETNLRQNEICARARDLLLPRLVSGELDVSELDITTPEANA
jgi:type I restriction enzyme S subunit